MEKLHLPGKVTSERMDTKNNIRTKKILFFSVNRQEKEVFLSNTSNVGSPAGRKKHALQSSEQVKKRKGKKTPLKKMCIDG